MTAPRRLTLKGVTKTISAWARELGLCRTTIERRLRNGCDERKALSTCPLHKQRLITVNGATLGMSDWARRLGIPPYVIRTRLARGWSDEDAVMRPLRAVRKRLAHGIDGGRAPHG